MDSSENGNLLLEQNVSRRGMWTLSFFYCTHTPES